MPIARILAVTLCCAFACPAALGQINDFTNWNFYRDPSDADLNPFMTGTSAANLAELDFTNSGKLIPAGYDIGFSSIDANTVAQATSGYYFSTANDFSVTLDFSLSVTNLNGFVALGLGIGEDREGVNSAGIGFGLASVLGFPVTQFQGAATNNDTPAIQELDGPVSPFVAGNTYAGTLSVAFDAATGDVTVGASGDGSSSTTTFTKAGDLTSWSGDDLLVSFFLRSDTVSVTDPFPIEVAPWSGTSAEADFLNFTVVEGNATQVPEPTSLALLGLGLGLIARRRW